MLLGTLFLYEIEYMKFHMLNTVAEIGKDLG